MAVGDRIHRDGQYEFQTATGDHSILFNGDDMPQIKMLKLDGLYGLPEQRKADSERQAADGLISGTSWYLGRILTGDIAVLADSEYEMQQMIMDLGEAMQEDDQDGMLVLQKARIGKRVIFCRPEKLAIPSTYDVAKGLGKGAIQWVAHDPRIYSFYEQQVTITIAPGQTSGQATAYMGGNWKRGVPCTIAVNGPGQDPRISNAAHNDREIRLEGLLGSGDVVVIDTGRLTVKDFPSGDSLTSMLALDSQWWALQKGDNVITVNRSTSAGTMTVVVSWRDAYVL